MKRQRGRNRNHNKNNNNNNNNPNRSMDSNGPDVRVRGNASTIYEKYVSLARDATVSGHRVKAENYLQHAEHYLRIVNVQEAARQAAREEREARQAARNENNNNSDDSDGEDDNRARRNTNNNRRRHNKDRDEARSETDQASKGTTEPDGLEVVEPKAKKPAKAKKPKSDNGGNDDEAPAKSRRRAPARKTESEATASEPAE